MSTNPSPGSRPSKSPTPPKPSPSRPSVTRQQRREAARRDSRLASARTAPASKPAWQSPMVLITAAAVVVGLVVVVFASGVLNPAPASVGNLITPLQPTTPVSLIDPTNPRAIGNPNAPVQMEIWSDFQCPACDEFVLNVEPTLVSQYVATGKVHLLYRDYAFIDSGAANGESHQAAAAARCAGTKFWPFHDYLFQNQSTTGENSGTFSAAFLSSVADAVGVDRSAYDACMANGAAATVAEVNAETAQGTAAGVHQTPTISLNGKLMAGGAQPMSALGPAIDALIPAGWTPAASAGASTAPTASPSPSPSTAP